MAYLAVQYLALSPGHTDFSARDAVARAAEEISNAVIITCALASQLKHENKEKCRKYMVSLYIGQSVNHGKCLEGGVCEVTVWW